MRTSIDSALPPEVRRTSARPGLAILAAIVVVAASSGCFTSWAIVQSTNSQSMLDEGGRERAVPLPRVTERLRIRVPLDETATPADLALDCNTTQHARDTVHRQAFRYGKRWKIATAIAFAVESAIAAGYYFVGTEGEPVNQLGAAFFGLDALGTAALFFAPRKEIFTKDERPVTTHVRSDCPAGLVLEIAGDSYPVDAAGRIGELGAAAFDAWMQAPSGPVRVVFGDHVVDLALGDPARCAWNRVHHGKSCMSTAIAVFANVDVPMGTLTRAD